MLYHARIHPSQHSTTLFSKETKSLYDSIKYVIDTAVECNADEKKFPDNWMFHRRWTKGSGKTMFIKENEESVNHRVNFVTVGGRTSAITCLQKVMKRKFVDGVLVEDGYEEEVLEGSVKVGDEFDDVKTEKTKSKKVKVELDTNEIDTYAEEIMIKNKVVKAAVKKETKVVKAGVVEKEIIVKSEKKTKKVKIKETVAVIETLNLDESLHGERRTTRKKVVVDYAIKKLEKL